MELKETIALRVDDKRKLFYVGCSESYRSQNTDIAKLVQTMEINRELRESCQKQSGGDSAKRTSEQSVDMGNCVAPAKVQHIILKQVFHSCLWISLFIWAWKHSGGQKASSNNDKGGNIKCIASIPIVDVSKAGIITMVTKYFIHNRRKLFYQQAGMVAKPAVKQLACRFESLVKQHSDDGM
ncbi:hypothetical protein T10_7018 [Trichinella papuae]|uniref:Uncharacterized protein n=1 Tax=Trichinella papuae TaxID=268474 RepID=A0A0V1MLF0_9BILA|nr:hypothetical protein T10_7018 [Trichinella papuae]